MSDNNPVYKPHYDVVGSGPLLIYIAGLDGTGLLFFKQIPALAQRYRVVTFRSRDRGHFTYEELTEDVAAIIRDLGETSATIVGESFGGTVALTFALLFPKMVDRLVIINSFARYPGRIRINIAATVAALVPFSSMVPARFAASGLGLYIDGVNGDDRRRFFAAIRTVSSNGYVTRLRLIKDLNLLDRLSEIRAPTLFIAGQRDITVPSVSQATAMASLVPNATLRVVDGVGHACLLGERVRLAELLDEWIGKAK
jgi:pimeloyl-ACP methyl ester carboxylesterase